MRKLLSTTATLAVLLVAMGTSPALAQVDAEMAFDPAEASVGDEVAFFVSVANLGDEAVLADIELSLSFGEFAIGPILGNLPLAAGEEMSQEIMLIVPPFAVDGVLTVELTATAGGFSDTATATLTVVSDGAGNTADGLSDLSTSIQNAVTAAGAVASEPSSFGEFKVRY